METKTFTVRGREVEGVQVEIPAGRAAYDLESQRSVQGPATIWQASRGGASAELESAESAVHSKPKAAKPKSQMANVAREPGRPAKAAKAGPAQKDGPPEL